MPNFNEVLGEIVQAQQSGDNASFDTIRRKYINELSKHTGRNVICYYSAWLSAPAGTPNLSIDDMDKNGLMNAVSSMDCTKGLDLLLHTPGGSITAAESLVFYLKQKFGRDIRAIIPQMAMSAGTMIACACKEIFMGHQSSIGPFDPHVRGASAFSVFDEFRRATQDIQKFPHTLPLWQSLLQKYPLGFLEDCDRAIQLARQLVPQWLRDGMLSDFSDAEKNQKIESVMAALNNPNETKEHSRHIHHTKARDIGLVVRLLEDDQLLQDRVLSVHHAYMSTLLSTRTAKIIENNNQQAFMLTWGANQ